jgi:hypothetical protein
VRGGTRGFYSERQVDGDKMFEELHEAILAPMLMYAQGGANPSSATGRQHAPPRPYQDASSGRLEPAVEMETVAIESGRIEPAPLFALGAIIERRPHPGGGGSPEQRNRSYFGVF